MKHKSDFLLVLPFVAFALFVPLLSTRAQISVIVVKHPSAKLSWSPGPVRQGATVASWNVYRAPGSAGPFALIANVPASTTSYVDSTVASRSRYLYKVTAVSTFGRESLPSSIATAVIPPPPAPLKVTGAPVSLWPKDQQSAAEPANDNGAVELGLRFTSDVPGYVLGIRFYKGRPNKGPHTGTLWSSTGTALATGTFIHEKPIGWQTLMFTDPVSIEARATYVVSYHTTVGQYANDQNYFTAAHDNPPLHAPANAGVFLYGPGGFPNQTYKATNYWIDLIFLPAP